MTTGRWRLLACSVSLLAIPLWVCAENDEAKAFNPKDLDHLEFFIESTKGIALATNHSAKAYGFGDFENTPLKEVWSDKKRFPHGTVRWWLDQSPYTNNKRFRPNRVFKTGRDLGQDDHDRPGYIPDGCNGKPCVRGGLIGKEKGKHHNKQPCYFEFQLESRDLKFSGPFSVFLLVRPTQQTKNFCYFGVYHRSVLIHDLRQNSLAWRNGGKTQPISRARSMNTGAWQLIELHRNKQNILQCVINHTDRTAGKVSDPAPFELLFLFNHNKGQGWAGLDPFAGDMAAMLIYRDELTNDERSNIRKYLNDEYRYMPNQ